MSEENRVLAVFVLATAASAAATYLFFVRYRIHRRAGHRGLRLLAGNAVVLLLLGTVGILGGELYYRFLYDTTDSFGLTKTTQRWFRRHFEFNHSGFRDSVRGYLPDPPPGRRRVTFLGDSFTAGHGVPDVEDRFANRVRASHPELEVHVIARCGWETGHELEFVELAARTGYAMDLVVLVYGLNDVTDISTGWKQAAERIFDSAPPGDLFEHSYLFNTIYYRWRKASLPEVANYFEFVRRDYDGGGVWEKQAQRLVRIRDLVRSRGGRLLVVTFPFLHALGEEYPVPEAHARLDRFWKEQGVPHLDLLGTFRDGRPRELTVNGFDAHPNERAHRLAAEAIGDFIEDHLGD